LDFYISSAPIVGYYNRDAHNGYKEGDIRVFDKSSISVIIVGNGA